MSEPTESPRRQPPFSEDAEHAVLSAMFLSANAVADVRAMLQPDAFYVHKHQRIYRAMLFLQDVQTSIDPLTVAEQLERVGDLEAAGGKEYIGYLTDFVPTASNVTHHAAIVRERAAQRDLIGKLEAAAKLAWSRDVSPDAIAQQLVADFLPLATPTGGEGYVDVGDVIHDVLREIERRASTPGMIGVPTGYTEIDDVTGGWREGEVVGICGVPKSGKSLLLTNFAVNNVLDSIDVGILTLEMTRNAYIERMLSILSRIESRAIRNGRLDAASWALLINAAQRLNGNRDGHIWIDETPGQSLPEIVARARALKIRHPSVRVLYVDYLQLIEADDETRAEGLRQVTRGLSNLGKELRIPIVVGAQLNDKKIEDRADKRPTAADVQGSSGLRQDASYLALVYRAAMYGQGGALDMIDLTFAATRSVGVFEARLEADLPHLTIRSPRNPEPAKARQEEFGIHV